MSLLKVLKLSLDKKQGSYVKFWRHDDGLGGAEGLPAIRRTKTKNCNSQSRSQESSNTYCSMRLQVLLMWDLRSWFKRHCRRPCREVAHRLSTIVNAHEIAFVENGQVKETGTHSTLLDTFTGF